MLFSARHNNEDKIIKYLLRRRIDTKKGYIINYSNLFEKTKINLI